MRRCRRPLLFAMVAGGAAIFVTGGVASATADDEGGWRALPYAPQAIYREGVPQTDAQGRPLGGYDPELSFFPIGLYHGVVGTHGGIEYGFEPIADAGFNTVVAWGGLAIEDVLAEAERTGLQVVVSLPRDDEVRAARGNPRVLGFDIDHEPSAAPNLSDVFARRIQFESRRDEIRAIDSGRAVFTVDAPPLEPDRIEAWRAWRRTGDVTSFFVYPVTGERLETLAGPEGIARLVSLAVESVGGRKPVWFVAQAFDSPLFDWRLPDARTARAMAYAAIVHGATGIVWFSFDSFVTRNGFVVGIAPAPRKTHGRVLPDALTDDFPVEADADQLRDSRALWEAVTRLNREIERLSAVWLAPSSTIDYTVEVRGRSVSATPVRTLLKRSGDDRILVGVNLDDRPLAFRVSLARPVISVEPLAGHAAVELDAGRVVGDLPGFGTFVLKLGVSDR